MNKRITSTTLTLFGATLLAWAIALHEMRGMGSGPGASLGSFGWFVGVWATMMIAMMLPGAAPGVLAFSRYRGTLETCAFLAGQLAVWTTCGVAAYVLDGGVRRLAPPLVSWDSHGAWVAGAAVAAAGLYQLTPLKAGCLRFCRSPLHLLMRTRPGVLAAVRSGCTAGLFCVGCCAGLMLALFALGVMSLVWMAVVAAAITAEKTLDAGDALAVALAAMLFVLGAWLAFAPSTIPGLQQPIPMHRGMG